MVINLDLYQSVAIAGLVFALGVFIKNKISFFERHSIPSPVIGGIAFALVTLALHSTSTLSIQTDTTMQRIFMTLFFTSVGFTASFRLLKLGGVQVITFLMIATVIVILQNMLGVGLAKAFDLDPLIGLTVGSVSMVGGHGTAGSFGPSLETLGVHGASAVAIASATFGLVMGGVIGGPIGRRLIARHNLKSDESGSSEFEEEDQSPEMKIMQLGASGMLHALFSLFIAAGIGNVLSNFIAKTGMTFPSYIGAMVVAAVLRNTADLLKIKINSEAIHILGSVSLSVFLSMALMNLKLWELAQLAIPMVIMLIAQTALMAVIAYFLVYNMMGRDYEAAILSSATCGFGMGATPNAIANMQALTDVFGPAPRAFFVVPLVGSLFIDFVNASVITTFINILK